MKKIVVCITVAMFFVMMPFVSFAKKAALSDSELGSTTAQEGVTIEFGGAAFPLTHFAINGNFAPSLQSWGDGDGCSTCGGYTDKGWVGTKNMSMDAFTQYGNGSTTPAIGSFIAFYNKMDIDIGTSGTSTKAFIALPSALVHPEGFNATLAMSTTADLNDGQENLGTFYNSLFALLVNPQQTGLLSISSHATGNEGVEIGFSGATSWGNGVMVAIPNTQVVASWGDSDGDQSGATTYTDAGYFGAKNLEFGYGAPTLGLTGYYKILISGTMKIDVGTDSANNTAVIIGLPTVSLFDANITAPLVFASDKQLATNVQSLGTLYTGGVQVSPSGSLVISAHGN